MRRLTIVFHDAGGGHRSSADALRSVLVAQEAPWDVQLLNLQELLDPLDTVRRVSGVRIQDTYNQILRRGWTRTAPRLLRILQEAIRLYHWRIVDLLQSYWRHGSPDAVLSVIPHFNRALAESLRSGSRRAPFITLMTDLADYPPHFWIERESQYIITGTSRAKQQALGLGHSEDHVFEISGMVLKPSFYESAHLDRAQEREKLGLDPDCTTAVVLFGGYGARVMLDIARRLDNHDAGVQMIMLCGRNEKLATKLRQLRTKKPILVQTYTSNVKYYMALADFFIGKPGPGSVSEALQLHLPVVLECNSKTLPQERYNAEWVKENKFGVVLESFKEIGACVLSLIRSGEINHLRRSVGGYVNKALFEVPGILDHCLDAQRMARLEKTYDSKNDSPSFQADNKEGESKNLSSQIEAGQLH